MNLRFLVSVVKDSAYIALDARFVGFEVFQDHGSKGPVEAMHRHFGEDVLEYQSCCLAESVQGLCYHQSDHASWRLQNIEEARARSQIPVASTSKLSPEARRCYQNYDDETQEAQLV